MNDPDRLETQEWIDALRSVTHYRGPGCGRLREEALLSGTAPPFLATTPYRNTIRPEQQAISPGNREIEHRVRSIIRWNAAAIILHANKTSSELGGHIASFQSSALLYDIGFEHFWHGASAHLCPERSRQIPHSINPIPNQIRACSTSVCFGRWPSFAN